MSLLKKYPSNQFKKNFTQGNLLRNTLEESYTLINKNVEKVLSKQSYIENLSHEILTPISVITGKIELLLQSKHLEETDFEIVGSILQHLQKLTKVNKSLILLSKIDAEVYDEVKKVELNIIIDDILNLFEFQIREKQLKIRKTIHKKVVIKTNVDLFEILIMNLIKNAIVHNKQGGSIKIDLSDKRIKVFNQSSHNTMLSSEIFQRFKSSSKSKKNLGLGLSIVNKINHYLGYTFKYTFSEGSHVFTVYY